jgi:NTP pyrophosphatase (non-canonical NTP hydrolase)
MEAKLEENRHKGDREGWQRDHARALFIRLQEELKELELAIDRPVELRRSHEIRSEAADVANFAMMIADVAGGLEPDSAGVLGELAALTAAPVTKVKP